MPARRYHQTIAAVRAGNRRRRLKARLDNAFNSISVAHQPAIVQSHILPLDTDINNADLGVKANATGLADRLAALERDLPGLVWRQKIKSAVGTVASGVKSALTPTKPKLAALAGTGLLAYLWSQQTSA